MPPSLDARLLRFRTAKPDPRVCLDLAEELLTESRPKDAIEVLSNTAFGPAENASAALLLAKAHFAEHDFITAQKVFVEAATLKPDDPEPLRGLTQVLLRRDDPHRARRVLRRAVELAPDRGDLKLLLNRVQKAVEQKSVAPSSDVSVPKGVFNLGEFAEVEDSHDDSEEVSLALLPVHEFQTTGTSTPLKGNTEPPISQKNLDTESGAAAFDDFQSPLTRHTAATTIAKFEVGIEDASFAEASFGNTYSGAQEPEFSVDVEESKFEDAQFSEVESTPRIESREKQRAGIHSKGRVWLLGLVFVGVLGAAVFTVLRLIQLERHINQEARFDELIAGIYSGDEESLRGAPADLAALQARQHSETVALPGIPRPPELQFNTLELLAEALLALEFGEDRGVQLADLAARLEIVHPRLAQAARLISSSQDGHPMHSEVLEILGDETIAPSLYGDTLWYILRRLDPALTGQELSASRSGPRTDSDGSPEPRILLYLSLLDVEDALLNDDDREARLMLENLEAAHRDHPRVVAFRRVLFREAPSIEAPSPVDEVLQNLARALSGPADQERRHRALNRALELAPTRFGGVWQRIVAHIARDLGETSIWARAIQAALPLAPSDSPAMRIALAETMASEGQSAHAFDALAQLLTQDELSGEDRITIYRALVRFAMQSNDRTLSQRVLSLLTSEQGHLEPHQATTLVADRLSLRRHMGDDVLEEAAEFYEGHRQVSSAARVYGAALVEQGQWQAANRILTSISEEARFEPEGDSGALWLARTKVMLGDEVGAIEVANELLQVRPSRVNVQAVAALFLASAQYNAAARALADMEGSSFEMTMQRIEAAVGARDQEATTRLVSENREALGESFEGAALLSRAEAFLGNTSSALALAERAETPEEHLLAGDVLYEASEVAEANNAYLRARNHFSDESSQTHSSQIHANALIGLAKVAIRGERWLVARSFLTDAERVTPSDPSSYEEAAAIARAHVTRQYLWGRYYLGRDSRQRASREFEAAVTSLSITPDAYFFLAESLAGRDAPRARAAYERYLEMRPEGEYANRARRATE